MPSKSINGASAPVQSNPSNSYAHRQLSDFGPCIFSPFIGHDAAGTFSAVESGMEFVHRLISSDDDLSDIRPGLALLVQTIWAAVQYEAYKAKEENGGAA